MMKGEEMANGEFDIKAVAADIHKASIESAEENLLQATHDAEIFERDEPKYGPWEPALLLACEYMFSLNRLEKGHRGNHYGVYALKRKLIKMLYQNGYCTECLIHNSSVTNDNSEVGGGITSRQLRFVAFRFAVGGKTFAWHSPIESIDFSYQVTTPAADYALPAYVKDVPLDPSQFQEAMDLISWVVLKDAKADMENAQIALIAARDARYLDINLSEITEEQAHALGEAAGEDYAAQPDFADDPRNLAALEKQQEEWEHTALYEIEIVSPFLGVDDDLDNAWCGGFHFAVNSAIHDLIDALITIDGEDVEDEDEDEDEL
jgi:hypothetical protein